jgi:hypothetical protein
MPRCFYSVFHRFGQAKSAFDVFLISLSPIFTTASAASKFEDRYKKESKMTQK